MLSLAEEAGLSFRLGGWLLDAACEQVGRWQDLYPSETPLTVHVNLSSTQFRQSGLDAQVAGALRKRGLEPSSLALGVEASAAMQDVTLSRAVFRELEALDVRLSLEKFGAGLSSLAHLGRFPLDLIEPDRTFIESLQSHSEDAVIVSTIVDLAHQLGLQTVAAGLESRDEALRLRHLGFDLAHGRYFGGPSTAEAMTSLLAEKPSLAWGITSLEDD